MQLALQIAQITIAVLIIFLTAIQGKGSGIKSSLGASTLYSTRRGAEKFIFRSTIFLGIIFAALSTADIFI